MSCKGGRKEIKYKCLCIEKKRMWHMKCTILPVITVANGMVRKVLLKGLEAIPGTNSKDSLQKTAILETLHITRKVLQSETCSLAVGSREDVLWRKGL
jgi:hypothetical protein